MRIFEIEESEQERLNAAIIVAESFGFREVFPAAGEWQPIADVGTWFRVGDRGYVLLECEIGGQLTHNVARLNRFGEWVQSDGHCVYRETIRRFALINPVPEPKEEADGR